jgi:uncharacterized membrane protein
MRSKVEVAGHAIHPMLIVFPLGLLVTSVVWDIAALATGHRSWGMISYWTIVAGVVGALVAAVPGFIDWLAIPRGTRARSLGLWHMIINLGVVALFAISLYARWKAPGGYPSAGVGRMIWGWIAVAFGTVSAWMGGELVETLGISVREDANPNAPSSLRSPKTKTSSGHTVPIHRT